MLDTRIEYCSAGVFDVNDINRQGDVVSEPLDFDFKTFFEKTAHWGELEPRPKVKYEVATSVDLGYCADDLAEYSLRKTINSPKKHDLYNLIREFLMYNDEPTRQMFCIHSRIGPHRYYAFPIAEVAVKLSTRPFEYRPFPSVIIITDTVLTARHSVRKLKFTKREKNYKSLSICDLTEDVPEGPSLSTEKRKPINILVGSAELVEMYIKSMTAEQDMLKLCVKHCVVVGVEQLATNSDFSQRCSWICKQFSTISPTNFIFMYRFLKSPSKLVAAMKMCTEMVRGDMFVEVEQQKTEDLYSRIEYRLVTSSDDLADRLTASEISKGNDGVDFSSARLFMKPIAQKVQESIKIIDFARADRLRCGTTTRRARKERILIITKDARTAIFVTMCLRMGERTYNVDKIVAGDPVEHVETRNFEFRWHDLDVLVIDWRSIHAVNRGTVDTVILFDAPEKKYFATILDVEMQNLISQIAVKLKLFILIDQQKDVMLMGDFAKHLEKHHRTAPQWFAALYETFVSRWHQIHEERQIFRPPVLENTEQLFMRENDDLAQNERGIPSEPAAQFDPFNMSQDPDGNYVIPTQCATGDDHEGPEGFGSPMNSDEIQLDYENSLYGDDYDNDDDDEELHYDHSF